MFRPLSGTNQPLWRFGPTCGRPGADRSHRVHFKLWRHLRSWAWSVTSRHLYFYFHILWRAHLPCVNMCGALDISNSPGCHVNWCPTPIIPSTTHICEVVSKQPSWRPHEHYSFSGTMAGWGCRGLFLWSYFTDSHTDKQLFHSFRWTPPSTHRLHWLPPFVSYLLPLPSSYSIPVPLLSSFPFPHYKFTDKQKLK